MQDDGGTGRIECLYEGAKRGVGAVQFVVARLTTEDRWASRASVQPFVRTLMEQVFQHLFQPGDGTF